MPCEDENRNQSNASLSQRTPKTASKPPEARREAWNRFPPWSSERANTESTLILDFQPPELWDNKFLFEPPSLWYFVTKTLGNNTKWILNVQVYELWNCYFGHTALIHSNSGNRSSISLWGSIFTSILLSLTLSPSYLVKHLDSSTNHRDRLRNRTNATKFAWQLLEESLVLLCQARTQKHLLWSCCLSM